MNEENMSLSLYSDLDDKIKVLKIENSVSKDKITALKWPIKDLVKRNDKFTWEIIKLMQK